VATCSRAFERKKDPTTSAHTSGSARPGRAWHRYSTALCPVGPPGAILGPRDRAVLVGMRIVRFSAVHTLWSRRDRAHGWTSGQQTAQVMSVCCRPRDHNQMKHSDSLVAFVPAHQYNSLNCCRLFAVEVKTGGVTVGRVS